MMVTWAAYTSILRSCQALCFSSSQEGTFAWRRESLTWEPMTPSSFIRLSLSPAKSSQPAENFPLYFSISRAGAWKEPMGGGEGKVEKKGFVLGCLLEEGDSLLADRIGEVVVRVLHEFLVD